MKYLKIETLDKGWHDRDSIILHSCMQCLVDYVEKENGLNHGCKTTYEKEHTEIKEIYNWWKSNHQTIDPTDGICDDMLIRLMKIRTFLWT